MIKRLLLKWLFCLLDDQNYNDLDEDMRVLKWLGMQRRDQGFHQFYQKRSYQLLRHCGNGLEGKDYWITVGQRKELLMLLVQMRKAEKELESRKPKVVKKTNK